MAAASAQAGDDRGQPRGRILTHADSYVRMQPLRAAVQTDYRIRGMLSVTIGLDAPESRTRRLIQVRESWLRDAYTQALLLYAGRMYRWGDVPDAVLIADLLQAETDRMLGAGEARIILDTVIIQLS